MGSVSGIHTFLTEDRPSIHVDEIVSICVCQRVRDPGKQYEEEIGSDHGTDMKGRKIRFGIGVTLLVISGLFWLFLILGTSDADQSAAAVVLGGLIISAIPIGIGVWLVRGRSSVESALTADTLPDLTSASPQAVELSRDDTPLVAMPAGKTGGSGLSLSGLNLAWYEWVLVLLPIVLVIPGFTGGWLGGAAFGAGLVLNLRIMRSDESLSRRAAEAAGVTIGLIVIYLAVVYVLSTFLPR